MVVWSFIRMNSERRILFKLVCQHLHEVTSLNWTHLQAWKQCSGINPTASNNTSQHNYCQTHNISDFLQISHQHTTKSKSAQMPRTWGQTDRWTNDFKPSDQWQSTLLKMYRLAASPFLKKMWFFILNLHYIKFALNDQITYLHPILCAQHQPQIQSNPPAQYITSSLLIIPHNAPFSTCPSPVI